MRNTGNETPRRKGAKTAMAFTQKYFSLRLGALALDVMRAYGI
jgi:hypothetical protein